jgi:hypothetical protein
MINNIGRGMTEMELKKWVPSSSLGFLTQGSKQNKLSLDEELKIQTVETLDGIPDWLTMFGHYFTVNPRDYDKVLGSTLRKAISIVAQETRNITKLARGLVKPSENSEKSNLRKQEIYRSARGNKSD